jgi:lipopolysaccharide export LptBFGC system permease protein LptF
MLQNKIYQNFLKEILKTFLVIILGLSIISLTVRAVNFLDLIVDSGYPVTTYLFYSILNLFGLAPKFIPLAFLVAIMIFILKHAEDSEFVILWTSGVKKIKIVNLLLLASSIVLIIYLLLSTFLTPLALNKSRQLLSSDQLNSFLPTIRAQQFSDTFSGFTFIVKKKNRNEMEHVFIHDKSGTFNNLSSNTSESNDTTIIAEKGFVEGKNLFLLNGQIITSKKNQEKNEIVKFEELNINLTKLKTTTIKKIKLQETNTIKLLKCFTSIGINDNDNLCNKNAKKEILPILLRRLILPFYIPLISLICSFLLFKNSSLFSNNFSIFLYTFILLVLTELVIKFTGTNLILRFSYIISPFILSLIFYLVLQYKFSKETKLS